MSLLREDAVQTMPPYAMWLRGAEDIGHWMLGPGSGCRGSVLLPVDANGTQAYAQYRIDPEGGHRPWALQVIEVSGGLICGIHSFLDTERVFPAFGLPDHLPR